jgi:hypothetical protein
MLTDKCTSAPDDDDVGVAAVIVASLIQQGYISLDLQSSDSRQNLANAVDLCATILTRMRVPVGDVPELPFAWGWRRD